MSEQNKMPDPLDAFREWIGQWERQFDAAANRLMGTEEFSQAMNQFQNVQLSMQKMFGEAMSRQLTTMNMPTREDVLRVGEMVHSLDKRLARVESALTRLGGDTSGSGTSRARKGPPRTKRPPADSKKASADTSKGESA